MSKSTRKEKWKNVSITPQNVDEYLTDLYNDTKAQYINQGVSFNKDDPYQMGLLKMALLEPHAFSGLCKQLLASHFANKQQVQSFIQPVYIQQQEKPVFTPPITPADQKSVHENTDHHVSESDLVEEKPSPTPASLPERKRNGGKGGFSSFLTPQT